MTEVEKKYAGQYYKAVLQIETLHLAIENHETAAVTVGVNFGHVGDLEHLNSQLTDIIRFLQ